MPPLIPLVVPRLPRAIIPLRNRYPHFPDTEIILTIPEADLRPHSLRRHYILFYTWCQHSETVEKISPQFDPQNSHLIVRKVDIESSCSSCWNSMTSDRAKNLFELQGHRDSVDRHVYNRMMYMIDAVKEYAYIFPPERYPEFIITAGDADWAQEVLINMRAIHIFETAHPELLPHYPKTSQALRKVVDRLQDAFTRLRIESFEDAFNHPLNNHTHVEWVSEPVARSMIPQNQKECAICMETIGTPDEDGNLESAVRLNACGHVFGAKCLSIMIAGTNGTIPCPLCREGSPSRQMVILERRIIMESEALLQRFPEEQPLWMDVMKEAEGVISAPFVSDRRARISDVLAHRQECSHPLNNSRY